MSTRSIARAVERLRAAHPALRVGVALAGMALMGILLFFSLMFSAGVRLGGYDFASVTVMSGTSSVSDTSKIPTPSSVLRETLTPIAKFGEFSIGSLVVRIFEAGSRVKDFFWE